MPDANDLRPAPPEYYERITRLIAAYFPRLRDARIQVMTRATADGTQTVQAWGEADTPDNPSEARQFDFTIWFAQDVWQTLDEYERDALTFHELSHCQWTEQGAPLLIDHDVEVFDAEIAIFGLWWPDAQTTIDALNVAPPPHHGAESEEDMPHQYQRPMRGSHGSSGAGSHGSSGAGSHGSSGAGSHGSSGAYGTPVYTDPAIARGGDFYTVDLGNGEVLELCPDCFMAAAQSIFGDLLSMVGGDMPQPGSHGSSGA